MNTFFTKKKLFFSLILLLLIISFFVGRNIVFHYALRKIESKLEKNNMHQSYLEASLKGFKGALLRKYLIINDRQDTVFYSDSIYLNLKISKLFIGQLGLSELSIFNTKTNLNTSIFDIKKDLDEDSLPQNHVGYNERLSKLFRVFFNYVPTTLNIEDFSFKYTHDAYWCTIRVPDLKIQKKNIEGYLVSIDSLGTSICNIKGNYDAFNERFNFTLYGEKNKSYLIPYITQRTNTKAQFDSVKVEFNLISDNDDALQINGILQAAGLELTNKKIGPSPVKTELGSLNFQLMAGNNYIELDSASQVKINDFAIRTYFKFEKDSHRFVTLKIPQQEFKATDLFESFPSGLFSSIRDMKVKGNLNYALDFFIDLDEPDTIKFSSTLLSKGFKIERMGDVNLYMMNDTFTHTAYNPDGSSRRINVNHDAADFTPLNEISSYLKDAVLTSEDGSFFYHRGFNEEAITRSISTNVKEKKFKRGGSTISMQLVKNIYLTRNKTISRKLEEIFMVWMIENMHLTSKERMYEVYLNIIEWGPNIYGIKEASEFYFNKKPSELTLKESIFLASIIPSPRNFKYSFDEEGHLKSILNGYFSNVAGIMLRREQINAADTINLLAGISLAPAAKKYVIKEEETDEEETSFFKKSFQFFFKKEAANH